MIQVHEGSYQACSIETRVAFDTLNFGDGGSMIRVLAGLKGGNKRDITRADTRVLWVEDDHVVVGWAILVDPPIYNYSNPEVYYFILPERRRQGLGTLLMRASRLYWGTNFRVCRHNNEATYFFDKTDKV